MTKTSPVILHAQRLEQLLGLALDLDAREQASFLLSDNVEPELREELTALLKAAMTTGPLERPPAQVAKALMAKRAAASSTVAGGQRVGQYRLIRLLGEGGMASVWLAERDKDSFSHQVAIKCLKTGLATAESRARFLREQQILAQLQHPHIARLYDAGVTPDGVPFIVMEWVDGTTLTHYCDEKKLTLTQRLQLFQKISMAVSYAHQNLVVHRDLKPANILVGLDSEPKLLDFGIAKLLDESIEPMTRSGIYLLTPEYAAPEQFGNTQITTAADVYALGAILYELLCGLRHRHFQPIPLATDTAVITTPSEGLRRLTKITPDNPNWCNPIPIAQQRGTTSERLRRTIAGDLDTIVLKALQPAPNRRYLTVQALNSDIECYLQQQPIQARKDSWAYRTGKYLQRHAIGVTLSLVVASTLVAATAISTYQAQRAEAEALRAKSETHRAESETQRAEAEAKRATAVKDFLTNLFQVSDSGLPRDQVPNTETLLQDGAKRIGSQFNDTPELKFDLLLLLGSIQLNLGQHDQAESLLKEAVIIADKQFPPANELWLKAYTAWANWLKVNRPEQTAPLITAAINKYRSTGIPKDNVDLANALQIQAWAYAPKHINEAIALAEEALAIEKRLFGDHHIKTHEALSNLAGVLSMAERWNEAEAPTRASLALSRELYGERHAKYAENLLGLVWLLERQGKYEEAEHLARQALAICESVYSKPNLLLVVSLNLLSTVLVDAHKFDEAETLIHRALSLHKQMTKAVNKKVLIGNLHRLSTVASGRHKYQKAERLLRQAITISNENYGPQHLNADLLANLGTTLFHQKRYREAETTLQNALDIRQKKYGFENYLIGYSLADLAELEIAIGQPQQALNRLVEALRIFEKIFNADHPALVHTRVLQSKALNQLARYVDANDLLVSLIPRMRGDVRFLNEEANGLADGLTQLGHAQFGMHEPNQALANWNDALALRRAMQIPDTKVITTLEKLIAQGQKAKAK